MIKEIAKMSAYGKIAKSDKNKKNSKSKAQPFMELY